MIWLIAAILVIGTLVSAVGFRRIGSRDEEKD